ncbi:hypothetical protein PAPYR_594 [Paratrimastix pyriformis]|uniref:SWIM-type domain-containing protein n=1 Tax=Paratrimastix pyriformis TaxID=342808 RepID=A0ABQ8UYF3_9EUKA|nr:hypothetical protein PAPYR_594 [Paratrimastix pyriformis]
MNTFAGAVIPVLLSKIRETPGSIPDDVLYSLYYIFKQTLVQALEILDQSHVTRLSVTGTPRSCFLVQGKNSHYLTYSHYCSCPSFMYSVISRLEVPMCKHQLAAVLAEAMGHVQERPVSEEEFVQFVSSPPPEVA